MIRLQRSIFEEQHSKHRKKGEGILSVYGKHNFFILLLIHIEWNKNSDGECYMSIEEFFHVYKIRYNSKNLKSMIELLELFITEGYIEIEISKDSFADVDYVEELSFIKRYTIFKVIKKSPKPQYHTYTNEFVREVIDLIAIDNNNIYKQVELYFFILGHMFIDEYGNSFKVHISYDDIILRTSINSKTTIKSYLDFFISKNMLVVERKASIKDGDFDYNLFSLPKEIQEYNKK